MIGLLPPVNIAHSIVEAEQMNEDDEDAMWAAMEGK